MTWFGQWNICLPHLKAKLGVTFAGRELGITFPEWKSAYAMSLLIPRGLYEQSERRIVQKRPCEETWTREQSAFPWSEWVRMQQTSVCQADITESAKVCVTFLAPSKGWLQTAEILRKGLELLMVERRKKRWIKESEPVNLPPLGLWHGKQHLRAPKDSHSCLEEQHLMSARQSASTSDHCYVHKHVPVSLKDDCLFLQRLLPLLSIV